MLISIYRNSAIIDYVRPDDNSELYLKLMSDNLVKLNFTHNSYLELQIGDYITFRGVAYTLATLPEVKKTASNKYEYTCKFWHEYTQLKKVSYLLGLDFSFDLTGTAQDFLNLAVENLNRDLGGYTAGTCEVTQAQTLNFDNLTVLGAMDAVADAFSIEWYVSNKTLHFAKRGANTGLYFKVGRHVGMYELTRKAVESADLVTRVWGYGSQDNLAPDYVSPLVYARLAFENTGLNNESRVEANVNLYGVRETVVIFDDIKPERTGTITAINEANIRQFIDTAMDFDLNDYLLAGLTPKVNFLTGDNAGITFDLSYDHATKTFTVDFFTDESGTYPNDTLRFAVGDQYKLFDIYLPESYVTDAKNRLRAATEEHLAKYSVPNVLYELATDEVYTRNNDIAFNLGDTITIIDVPMNVSGELRITQLRQSITQPNKYNLEVGELLAVPLLTAINNSLNSVKQQSAVNANNIQTVTLKKADINAVYTQVETEVLIEAARGITVINGATSQTYTKNLEFAGNATVTFDNEAKKATVTILGTSGDTFLDGGRADEVYQTDDIINAGGA